MEILKIEELTFTYPLCPLPSVKNITFGIEKGEFAVLCGSTGSGKSTLLRLIKREISPKGEMTGRVLYRGTPTHELDSATASFSIGFIAQDPEQQIVCDKVWHELAFGLENMGIDQDTIARRVAEMSCYFGIEEWFEKDVSELSGGQKQILNLASVMVMNPDILILDEPTSQLDPIAAVEFITTLKKLNTELSMTVLIAEHRLEELIPICDRLIVLEDGKLTDEGDVRSVLERLQSPDILASMPSSVRLYHSLNAMGQCPLTVKEGRDYIEKNFKNSIVSLPTHEYTHSQGKALEFKSVYFRYERELPDVLKNMDLTVYENEIFCILGGNGSGKTTALRAASGLIKPYSGQVKVFGKRLKDYKNQSLYRECLSLLPQDVNTVFLKNTVKEELDGIDVSDLSLPFDISHLYDKHPYDLSGGEKQLVALLKVLSTHPKLLIMDEPTKGLDAGKKALMTDILKELKANGVTALIVTHDVEFAATTADRCAMCFRGQMISSGTPEEFFSENRFYTTAASRMSRGYFDRAVTLEQVAKLCTMNSEGEEC